MDILNIKQLKAGRQEKRYGDHIYQWTINARNATKEELLEYCQKNLKEAKREHSKYLEDYRNQDLTFDQRMEVVCGGWYTLTQNADGTWEYIVHYEYID